MSPPAQCLGREADISVICWLKGTCAPTGMEDVWLRHTRTVLHKQAPACVACPCMERQFVGMNKIVMAEAEARQCTSGPNWSTWLTSRQEVELES